MFNCPTINYRATNNENLENIKILAASGSNHLKDVYYLFDVGQHSNMRGKTLQQQQQQQQQPYRDRNKTETLLLLSDKTCETISSNRRTRHKRANNQLTERIRIEKLTELSMKGGRAKQQRKTASGAEMNGTFTNIVTVILFLIFASAFYLVISFKPLTKEEQVENYNKMNDDLEPFRKNLSECARQVKASMVDVENFLKRIPQSSMQGKCFVACILKRNTIIEKNKIVTDNLVKANRAVYGDDSEVMSRLKLAIKECKNIVEGIFEICEYASVFNDCMHMKMEHILDKVTMERRMEALGQMSSDPDEWTEEDDELLKFVKDEL